MSVIEEPIDPTIKAKTDTEIIQKPKRVATEKQLANLARMREKKKILKEVKKLNQDKPNPVNVLELTQSLSKNLPVTQIAMLSTLAIVGYLYLTKQKSQETQPMKTSPTIQNFSSLQLGF